MWSKIINSRYTWIVLPILLILTYWSLAKRALDPLTIEQTRRVIAQINNKAGLKSDPVLIENPLRYGSGSFDSIKHNEFLKREPNLFRTHFGSFSDIPWQSIVSALERNPSEAEAFAWDLKAAYINAMEKSPGGVFSHEQFGTWSFVHGAQMIAMADATVALEARNTSRALDSLRFVSLLDERVIGQPNSEHQKTDWFYDAMEHMVQSTTSPELLDQVATTVDDHLRVKPIQFHPTLQHVITVLDGSFKELATRFIVTNALSVAGDAVPDYAAEVRRIHEGRYYELSDTFLPWTPPIALVEKSLRALATTEGHWEQQIPEGYLEGLTGRERLIGAALLLQPREKRNQQYLQSRADATRGAIIKAGIAARRRYLSTGQMPHTTEDLESSGVEPVAATDAQKVAKAMESAVEPQDTITPFGPLEVRTVRPGVEELESWFKTPNGIESAEVALATADENSTGATTTATVTVEMHNDPRMWRAYADWLLAVRRLDVNIIGFTVKHGDDEAAFPDVNFLDGKSTAALAGMEPFPEQVAGQFLRVHNEWFEAISFQQESDWPGFTEPMGTFAMRVTVEIPREMTKIELANKQLNELLSSKGVSVGAMYMVKAAE